MAIKRLLGRVVAALLLGGLGALLAGPAQARDSSTPQDYSECVVEGFVYYYFTSGAPREQYIDHRLAADGTVRFTESRADALRLRYDYSGRRGTLEVVDPRSDLVALALAVPSGGDATLAGAESATLVGAYELSATPSTISTSIGEVVATTQFYALEPVRWASLEWPNPDGAVISYEWLISATGTVILAGDPVAYVARYGDVRAARSAMIWDLGPRCPETAISTYPIIDGPVDVGDEIWVGATITSTKGGQIDGVATLYACGPSAAARACSTGGRSLGAFDAAGFPADEVSARFTPAERGVYCFRTEFVGWGLDDAVSAGTDSCIEVPTAAEPTPVPTTSTSSTPAPSPDAGAGTGDDGTGTSAPVLVSDSTEMPVALSVAFGGVLLAGIAALSVVLVQRRRRPRPLLLGDDSAP